MERLNCLIVDDEVAAREILEEYVSKVDWLQNIRSCSDSEEALRIIEKEKIDLLFLDINLPGISGINLAKMLGTRLSVVFTTAHRNFAVEGFEVDALDYLLKPISFERFFEAIQRVKKETIKAVISRTEETTSPFFFVMSDRKMVKIKVEDVQIIESLNSGLKIYLPQQVINTHDTAKNLESKLPASQFVRIHRSYIINVNHIDSYSKDKIEIRSRYLPISRSYKEQVLAVFNSLG